MPHVPTDYDPARRYPKPSPIWRENLIVTVSLSSFSGKQRETARAAGYTVVAVLLHNDRYAPANAAELRRLEPELRDDGWKIVGWAPAYHEGDGKRAGFTAAVAELDGWVLNLEAWAEGAHAALTARAIGEYRSTPHAPPLAITCLSSQTDRYARSFDYQACLRAGAMLMPQVYGSNHPGYTIEAMLGTMERAGVPETHLAPWLSIDQGAVPVADYQTWHGPHGIWTGDAARVGKWPLAR